MTDLIYYVYKLIDDRNLLPIYVGKGKNNRAISHISRAKKWKSKNYKSSTNINRKLCNKILSILDDGSTVSVKYLAENLTEKDALKIETETIAKIGLDNLCNLTEGGEGEKRSPEVIQKIKEKRKIWLTSEEGVLFKERLSAQRKGSGNPRFGTTEEEEHKKKRMKNMLEKPRWNKGLKGDPRCKGFIKGQTAHNAFFYKAINLITGQEYTGYIKEIVEKTNVPEVTIKRMLSPSFKSKKWFKIWQFTVETKNATKSFEQTMIAFGLKDPVTGLLRDPF